tara:strand:- start:3996 stop:4247 length:252 start_codon:yes stop_codon:yes gene_type:complete
MNNFKIGDLIGLQFNSKSTLVKTGIVTNCNKDSFVVKWTSYDKIFFMEKDDFMFEELNKSYLLSSQLFSKGIAHIGLVLLNPS